MSNLRKELRNNILFIYLVSFLAIPFGYLTRIIYSRSLTVEEYGLFYSILGFITLITIINEFGLSESLVYFGTRYFIKNNKKKLKESLEIILISKICLTLIFLTILYFCSQFLMRNYFHSNQIKIFKIFLIYYFATNILTIIQHSLLIKQKFKIVKTVDALRIFTIFIGSLFPIFLIDKTLINFTYALGTSLMLILILSIIFFIREFSFLKKINVKLSKTQTKRIFTYAYPSLLSVGALMILSRIDIQMITYFRNFAEVAYYENSMIISKIIFTIVNPIIIIFTPILTKLISKKEFKTANQIINTSYKYFILFTIPFLIIYTIFSKEILILLFSKKYVTASLNLQILTISSIISIFNTLNYSILASLNKVKTRMKILYFGAIFNIIGNLLIINYFGYVGVAAITTITIFMIFILTFYNINKTFKIKPNLNLFKIIITTALFFIFTNILKKTITNTTPLIKGIIILSITLPFYIGLSWYFEIWSFKEILTLTNLEKKFKKIITLENKIKNVLL